MSRKTVYLKGNLTVKKQTEIQLTENITPKEPLGDLHRMRLEANSGAYRKASYAHQSYEQKTCPVIIHSNGIILGKSIIGYG